MGLPSWDHSAPVGLAWDSNIIRYGASMGLSHHGFEVLPWDPHGTPTTLGASHGISVPPWDWHGIPMKSRTRYGVSMGLSLTMMGLQCWPMGPRGTSTGLVTRGHSIVGFP